MGYRSDVSFCLQVKEPEKFVALMKLHENSVIKEFLTCMWLNEGEGFLHFHSDYWKWYDESEKAFAILMNMARNYDEEFACRFARYGEEGDDIQEEAFGDGGWDLDYPYIVRSLDIGFDPQHAKKLIEEEKEDASA
jgi:hypothetical protein